MKVWHVINTITIYFPQTVPDEEIKSYYSLLALFPVMVNMHAAKNLLSCEHSLQKGYLVTKNASMTYIISLRSSKF